MKLIALNLPGGTTIDNPAGLKTEFTGLSSLVSGILNIVFYIAVFMAFFWLAWGAFQFLVSRGNKEEIARARGRIIWALVGLVIIIMSYTIAKYMTEIFPPSGGRPF